MYSVSSGVRCTSNEDGGIVLDIDHGQMFRLNPVAAFILESLSKGYSELAIAEQILRRYDVAHEIVAADVRDFVKSLTEQKLVMSTNESPGL
jgi:hypothetical protein